MNESECNRLYGTESGATGSGSAGNCTDTPSTPSALQLNGRDRLEHKIEKLREEIARNSIAREGDVEEYLKITAAMKNRPENPQMTRIRQHFEKKNRKYVQETEHLQKKLEILEQRLVDLDNGVESPLGRHGTHRVFHNVGHEIRRNLREMTGNVINAPLGIAQKVKKNVFGSADNIASVQENNVGLSIFYDDVNHLDHHLIESLSDRGTKLEHTKHNIDDVNENQESISYSTGMQNELNYNIDESSAGPSFSALSNNSMAEQFTSLKQQNLLLIKNFENFKRETENELRNQQTELINSRFKIQHLEQTLNETMELHQNEVKQLKNDLSLIGARMDYQYNDRFKKIEESVEAAQNRMIRMETSWLENSERLLAGGQNMWNVLMLSGANIVVELLKITLYILAVVLDSIKPFTGTRKRAGIAVAVFIIGFILWNVFASFFITSSSPPSIENTKKIL